MQKGRCPLTDHSFENLLTLEKPPAAIAYIRGVGEYAAIAGTVTFRPAKGGVLVTADVCGLPEHNGTAEIFGFHLHAGGSCTGTAADPLADTDGHYSFTEAPHPAHAGDLPPLFAGNGCAWMTVLTNRFTVEEIIGKTAVIHIHADDFTTQPAGNSGQKIACGVITKW